MGEKLGMALLKSFSKAEAGASIEGFNPSSGGHGSCLSSLSTISCAMPGEGDSTAPLAKNMLFSKKQTTTHREGQDAVIETIKHSAKHAKTMPRQGSMEQIQDAIAKSDPAKCFCRGNMLFPL